MRNALPLLLCALVAARWTFLHVDFARDGRKDDGRQTPFAAGHKVDDVFFFVEGDAELYIDEVTLYDGAAP